MKRYLITTDDERTWKMDQPVLFLGEWCCRYERKHVWSKMDAVIAQPYGLETGQKCRDIEYVLMLADNILDELFEILNRIHNTEHCKRYWTIVFGRWLQRYVGVVFNRYNSLEQAIKNYDIPGTAILNSKNFSLAPDDSINFVWACSDTQWNHLLYSRIIAYRGDMKQDVISNSLLKNNGSYCKHAGSSGKRLLLEKMVSGLETVLFSKLVRDSDAFIMSSYLPFAEEIKLQLSLGQVPQLWRSPPIEKTLPDSKMRDKLIFNYDQYEGFERYVRWQLSEIFPVCYLEGYKNIVNLSESLPWPRYPKFIYTSNCFDMNEVFQVWAAAKSEQGIQYFVGQHGNNYGTAIGNSKWPERVTADKFITWGWTDDNKNTVPAFIFKTVATKSECQNPDGWGLLIEWHPSFRLDPFDDYYEFGLYQGDQFRFVESLPLDIRSKIKIRLHAGYDHVGWCAEKRWKERFPAIKLEHGVIPLDKLIAKSRIVIHSYDSTGMLETLSLNIPTICFWIGGIEHIVNEARPYYELLRKADILLDSPEQAANMLTRNWSDINGWWRSKNVQEARSMFCLQYARTELYPIKALKNILLQSKDRCCSAKNPTSANF